MILTDPGRTLVIAHRGASGEYPENTLLAFRRGLEQGADALEFDVRLTADGVPVVIHDATLDRTTSGHGEVATHTLAQLARVDAGCGETVPTVAQVLTHFPGVPCIVEIKETAAAGPLVAVMLEHDVQDRVLVGAFRQRDLAPPRRAGFASSASRNESALFWLASRVGLPWVTRYDALTLPVRQGRLTVVDRRLADAARRRGIPVHVWTVDDPAEARRLRKLGARGIITNAPARMRGLGA